MNDHVESSDLPAVRDEVLRRYSAFSSPLVSDGLEACDYGARAADPGLVPFHDVSLRVAVGYAHTALARPTSRTVDIDALLELVETTSEHSMIVVAAEESVDSALWGGLMSAGVMARGATGAVIDGGVRDINQIAPMGLPVWATGRSPLDIRGRGEIVSLGDPVAFRGVHVAPKDLVIADSNGVVIVPGEAVPAVLDYCEARLEKENLTESELAEGSSIREVYGRHGAI